MNQYTKVAKKLKELIQKYETIVIFRHQIPDYDALGSQFGLLTWLKENFKEKKIYALGEDHKIFTGRIFPKCDVISDEELFAKPFLAIVLDTGNSERISDKRYINADYILKIDHHPEVEKYAKLNFANTSMAATGQYLGGIITSKIFNDKTISKDVSRYLYIAIVGDSGRFQYVPTNAETFRIISKLLKNPLDLQKEIYLPMYMKTTEDLKIQAYILSTFKMSEHGVAYYYMDDQTLTDLHITPERGKENINLLSNIEDIKIWVSFSESKEENLWRVSIRSREAAINEVAATFGGGGHKNASGAIAKDFKATLEIIKALDDLLI